MDNTNIVVLSVEQLREIIETTVCGCIEKVIGAFQPKHDSDSVDIDGALEFLNSNGYRIAKGQLYKETSAGNIPYHKFGHRLHFKISELRDWAELRLVSGNSVGTYIGTKGRKPQR